ncbi:MAG: TonB-dependent receptor, partial [Candidatus Poribacteria bacterium]|nr:TonB-dependent receptor [Candidatus Poribacteria bacterium]
MSKLCCNLFVLATVCFINLFSIVLPDRTAAENDSEEMYQIEETVVTSERMLNSLFESTAAVSVRTRAEMEFLPLKNLADALSTLPGISFLNRDGLGRDPLATLRGFYGGGEAEYLLVLIDGEPINELEKGLMNWNSVSLSNISSIEFLRGGASSLYGDSAIGGVVNVVTSDEHTSLSQISASGGGFGSLGAHARSSSLWNGRRFAAFGSAERHTGFREHADRAVENLGGYLTLLKTPNGSLTVSTTHHFQQFDEPGPLTGAELDSSRSQSTPFYKFDHTDDRTHRAAVKGNYNHHTMAKFSGIVTGEIRDTNAVRTLQLSPQFADTKNRLLKASRLTSSFQLTLEQFGLPFENRLSLGIDAGLHSLSSEYHLLLVGGLADYNAMNSATRGELDEKGDSTRRSAAGFLQYELRPIQTLRLILGVRADVIGDQFTPKPPSEGEEQSTVHSEISPKAGANYRYVKTERHIGNLYANVSKSFKAPTLDQLYDQRSIVFQIPPNPPFKVLLSSGDLQPQTGTSFEAGGYHRSVLYPDLLHGELSFAAYTMDMKNELDFDLQQLKYLNIGKSRHQGIETGLRFTMKSSLNLFFNYTHQSAKSR